MDRPAPDAYERWANPTHELVVSSSYSYCVPLEAVERIQDCPMGVKTWDKCGADPDVVGAERSCERSYEEAVESIRREHERMVEAVAPARGTEPRVVAELELVGGMAELVTWRTSEERLCTFVRVAPGVDGWESRLVGECVPYMPCGDICVETLAVDGTHFVLGGTIPSAARAFRVTDTEGAQTLETPGPVIDNSDRRVFLLDLGSDLWRRVEILEGDKVIDSAELLPEQALMWSCLHLLPDPSDESISTEAFMNCSTVTTERVEDEDEADEPAAEEGDSADPE